MTDSTSNLSDRQRWLWPTPIVPCPDRDYLGCRAREKDRMPQYQTLASRRVPRSAVIIAVPVTLLLVATIVLWAHYGTAVFFEMIVSGIASCL